MKLDVSGLRYLTKEHFGVLSAIEMGMKNHEVVPVTVITSIAKLRHGGVHKILSHLLRNKLIAHDGNAYDGFRLTYSGYDFLALQVFLQRGHIVGFGRQIGVGKESDIFEATTEDGTEVAIKLHRLGRTSFKAVKNKRDYLKNSNSVNWFHMSKLSALKEFAFMKALYDRDFPTPVPIDHNRHAIIMSLVKGYPLYQVRQLGNSDVAYNTAMSIVVRLAEHGLVHCDFNEFNIMIDDDSNITMIDFPQMISTNHPNASELFDRDVNGLVKFFSRLQGGAFTPDSVPVLSEIISDETLRMDKDIQASGFTEESAKSFETMLHQSLCTENEDYRNTEEVDVESEDEDVVHEDKKFTGSECSDDEEFIVDDDVLESLRKMELQQNIRNQVKKQGTKKKGSKKSRNSSKLSVKGRLQHKERA